MKRFKLLALIIALIFAVGTLTACGSKPASTETAPPAQQPPASDVSYKDGVYKATYDRNDVRNWKAFVEITVSGGKVTQAKYDYINDKGEIRTDNKGYVDAFTKANGYSPKDGFAKLAQNLVNVQKAEAVDVLAGATHSTKNFKELAAAALEKAKTGDTTQAVVQLYKNGTYKVEYDKFDDHGWKAFVELEIKDGNIASVNFDYVNKDGKLKTQDAGYKAAMEPQAKTYPEKFCEELERQLIDKQIISLVDAVTGATHSSENFKELVEFALDDMAEKGETGTKAIPMTAK